jgi:hypothetical protein
MTMSQTPWNTMLADRTRLTAKLRGQGNHSSVAASVTATMACSSRWNCPFHAHVVRRVEVEEEQLLRERR